MTNPNCTYCQGTGVRNNGYYKYNCQCNFELSEFIISPQIQNELKEDQSSFINHLLSIEKNQRLHDIVLKFMKDNNVTYEETIHQSDELIENVYYFLEELFRLVKNELEESNDA